MNKKEARKIALAYIFTLVSNSDVSLSEIEEWEPKVRDAVDDELQKLFGRIDPTGEIENPHLFYSGKIGSHSLDKS